MLHPTGQTLRDRYRIVKLLGQGGFGAVYRAWDITLNIPCALKENFETSAAGQKQFLTEARLLANLRHPNLPRVTDYFVLPGQGQYLVMDFIEGDDLRTVLERAGCPLDEGQVLSWIEQVCQAIEYLHAQTPPIIHRDIKPANIKITPTGQAVLVDFGLAKLYDSGLRTTQGARAITPGYSPQEQYGLGTTDARSDVYALGATLYHLLTNKEPVESIHRTIGVQLLAPRSLNARLSPELEHVILKAMQPVPGDRYATIASMRSEFPVRTPPASFSISSTLPVTPSAPAQQAPGSEHTAGVDAATSPAAPADQPAGIADLLVAVPDRLEYVPANLAAQPAGRAQRGLTRKAMGWIAAGLCGVLLLAIIAGGIASGLFKFSLPGLQSNATSGPPGLGVVPAASLTEAAPDGTRVSASPLAALSPFSPAQQGTAFPASQERINPQNAASLELLGIVTLTNRKSALAWSSDSSLVITSSSTGVEAYNLINLNKERSLFAGSPIICFALSLDEEVLAGGSSSGEAVLWEVANGSVYRRFRYTDQDLEFASGGSCFIRFSPDGQHLFTASTTEALVKAWDTASGELQTSLDAENPVSGLDLSPDGQTLAAGTSSGLIRFYDLVNGYQWRDLQPGHRGGIRGLAFSPDGQVLSYTFEDGYYESARTDTFAVLESRILGLGGGDGVQYSPDGSLLAVGSDASLVGIFLPEDMPLLASLKFRSLVGMTGSQMNLAFSPDGKYLAGTYLNYLYIWGVREK